MYKNYGDRDFFSYGMLVDCDHSDTEFNVLFCSPVYEVSENGEELFMFADCLINIEDPWIDKQAVMSFSCLGKDYYDQDKVMFAIDCITYYGAENFSSPYDGYLFTRKEIEDRLGHYLIATDNLDVTW